MRTLLRALALGGAVPLTLVLAAPARAVTSTTPSNQDATSHGSRFKRIDLVSDQPGKAPLIDPKVVNAWGLALGPTSPLWVANNGSDTATIYAGGLKGSTPTKVGLEVTIPGGAPTGQVFNGTDGFRLKISTKKSSPARFIFASEAGKITAWSPDLSPPTSAVVAAHVDGAVYKGLALFQWHERAFLFATDFVNNRVDVFDENFERRPELSRFFQDPALPPGYAPFNVMVSGKSIFVTFAKQTPGSTDETAGPGLGFVDEFEWGKGPERIASRGTLNAPWGLAIAPASFGKFAGALLVGNFGDGRIGAFRDDEFIGQLRDQQGKPISIDGLWALLPGTATTGGTGTLWFSAGPDEEQHGLVGQIRPVKTH